MLNPTRNLLVTFLVAGFLPSCPAFDWPWSKPATPAPAASTPAPPERPVSSKDQLVNSATQIIRSSFGDIDQPAHIAELTRSAVDLEWTDWWEYQFFLQAATRMTVVSRRISQLLTEKDRKVLSETTKKVGAEVSYSLTGPSIKGSGEAGFKDAEDDARKASAIIDRLPASLQDEYQNDFDALLRGYEHLLVAARKGASTPIPVPERVVKVSAAPHDIVVTQHNAAGFQTRPVAIDPRELPPPKQLHTSRSADVGTGRDKGRFPHEVLFDILFGGH